MSLNIPHQPRNDRLPQDDDDAEYDQDFEDDDYGDDEFDEVRCFFILLCPRARVKTRTTMHPIPAGVAYLFIGNYDVA